MTIKEAHRLMIGEKVITKGGVSGKVIAKNPGIISLNGLGETITIKIETDEGIVECLHKEVKHG